MAKRHVISEFQRNSLAQKTNASQSNTQTIEFNHLFIVRVIPASHWRVR